MKLDKQQNVSLDDIKIVIQDLNKNDIANKTSAGFIYQDLVLMKQLLFLENDGTKIGYEVLDDIHKENGDYIELIQVKSSINDDTLTESAPDLWKTLFNWAKIIESGNVDNIKFVFYTNRELSTNSNILNELIKNEPDIDLIINFINNLYIKLENKEKEKTKGQSENTIFKKVLKVNNLTKEQKEILFQNLSFIVSTDNIIKEIKQRIEFFAVDKEKDIDTVYENLLGIITNKRLELAKQDENFIIDYNYFRKNLKFDRILKFARVEEINFEEYYNYRDKNIYNENFEDNIFYKQLNDIDVPKQKINELARERASSSSFIEGLELLPSDENSINLNLIYEWEEIHEEEYSKTILDESDHKLKAQNCLNKTNQLNIFYKTSKLPKPLTKGKFIDLSNQPKIGWRLDWEEKYSE